MLAVTHPPTAQGAGQPMACSAVCSSLGFFSTGVFLLAETTNVNWCFTIMHCLWTQLNVPFVLCLLPTT